MTVSKDQFERFIVKLAQESAIENNEDATLKGQQEESVPEMLQPDDGPGSGPRGEHESLTSHAEKVHKQNQEGSYLPGAFSNFESAASQTGKEMKELLSSYGPDAIVSKATTAAGTTKISSASIGAFKDELIKIISK